MKIAVIGTGFVGVVTAAVLAEKGNQVVGVDIDESKVRKLTEGIVPFFEPSLSELLTEHVSAKRLSFTTDYTQAIPGARVIFIAVGTPSAADGGVDLRYVLAAAESVAAALGSGAIVVIKSTVPPGSFAKIEQVMRKKTKQSFVLASMPEFLREGSAVHDTQHPDRIVIGCEDPEAIEVLRQVHETFAAPIEVVNIESAQMGKYAANAYLATRISFINQIADLCEHNGADVMEVIRVIGRDKRIGDHYWYPGPGYGGSCFPKDVKELAYFSRQVGMADNLFNAIDGWNSKRIELKLEQFKKVVGGWKGKRVAVLGLAFKPNTDDTRESPALSLIPLLTAAGARVTAYDPKATTLFSSQIPASDLLTYCSSLEQAVAEADIIMSLVEWKEIINFDFGTTRLSKPQWFIDWRNQFTPEIIKQQGYTYLSIGRTLHG